MRRLTRVIETQQANPISRGLPPVFTSFTISVERPIAAIARIIKNLLMNFIGSNILGLIPIPVATVVITEAIIK